jgi:hypothetical protein
VEFRFGGRVEMLSSPSRARGDGRDQDEGASSLDPSQPQASNNDAPPTSTPLQPLTSTFSSSIPSAASVSTSAPPLVPW